MKDQQSTVALRLSDRKRCICLCMCLKMRGESLAWNLMINTSFVNLNSDFVGNLS